MIRFFRHYIPMSMVLLTMAEFVVFFFLSDFVARHYAGHPAAAAAGVFKPWLFAAILTLLNSTFGLYDWEWTKGLSSLLRRVIGSLFIAALLFAAGASLLPAEFAGGREYFVGLALALLVSILLRLLFMEWDKADLFKKRVVVLGTGSRAAKIEELVQSGQAQGLNVVGYLHMGAGHSYVPHTRLINEEGSIFEIATQRNVTEVIVAVRERRGGGLPMADLLECKLRGLHVMDLPGFFTDSHGVQNTGGISWDVTNDTGQALDGGVYYVKAEYRDAFDRVTTLIEPVQVLNTEGQNTLMIFNSAGEVVRHWELNSDYDGVVDMTAPTGTFAPEYDAGGGVNMASGWYKMPITTSLAVIAAILAASVIASLLRKPDQGAEGSAPAGSGASSGTSKGMGTATAGTGPS